MEAEKRKDRHDDDDKTDEVNYSVHGKSPGRVGDTFPLLTRTAVLPFRTSFHLDGRVGKQTLCCTAPPFLRGRRSAWERGVCIRFNSGMPETENELGARLREQPRAIDGLSRIGQKELPLGS
jgi:hypothetical protein